MVFFTPYRGTTERRASGLRMGEQFIAESLSPPMFEGRHIAVPPASQSSYSPEYDGCEDG